jgi:hypothetical protein
MRGEVREPSGSNRVAEHQFKLNRKVKGFGLTGRITRHSSIAAPAASKSDLWKSGRPYCQRHNSSTRLWVSDVDWREYVFSLVRPIAYFSVASA